MTDTIKRFVAFQEGGETKKLHYHCYIETTMTTQALTKWIYTQVDCIQSGEKGNSVFFTRAPHDATMGYIAKGKVCVIRHNYDITTIDEWFKQSDNYTKQRATSRKRVQRSRQDEMKEVYDQIELDLKENPDERNEIMIISKYLKYCKHKDYKFPTRSQMESCVLSLIYPYNPSNVEIYYNKSFRF